MSNSGDSADGEEQNPIVGVLQTVTPGFIRQSFAIKFGLVLLVMALSIGAIGFVATEVITAETEANAEANYQGDAAQQADVVQQWMQSNSLQTQLLSADQAWEGDNSAGGLTLEVNNQKRLGVADIHLVDDTQGGPQVVASTSLDDGEPLGETESRQWFASQNELPAIQGLADNDVYVSDTYDTGNQRVVGFVSPTTVGEDRYLFVEVSVSDIQQALRGSNPERDIGFTQVVNTAEYHGDEDNTQNVVMIDARGEEGKVLERYATNEDTLEPIQRATELRGETTRAGVIARMNPNPDVVNDEYTVGYAPVEDSEWVVVTHGPRSEVFGFVDTLSTWGTIVTIFSVLLIGIAGSALGYSTSSAIDRLTAKTEEMREGNLDVTLQTSRIDNIGQLYDGFADMRDSLKEQIEESEHARKEAEVARAEAEEMASYLQDKAEEYSDIMQQVGAGDLTQRMEQDGEEESMDHIAAEFNDMIEELEKTTGQLKSYVDEVEEAGAEVEQSADTVRDASEQVADSIQKISDDAYDQKERLQNISETMDTIAEQLETFEGEGTDVGDALEQIQEIASEISEIADLSEETMAEAENVAGAAEEQAAELNEVSGRANDLQRYAQPLRDILERFETESEHEFVFSVGPTGGQPSPNDSDD